MFSKKILGAAAASLMLAAAAAGQAEALRPGADQVSAKVDYFKTTVSPNSGVTSGTVLTAKSTGAKPSTSYYCVITAYTRGSGGAAPYQKSLKVVKSNRSGAITCKVTYKPFKAKDDAGTVRHCPTTKADRKAGFKCAVALADQATIGGVSASVGNFTPAR